MNFPLPLSIPTTVPGIDDLQFLDCRLTSMAQPLDAAACTLWAVLAARIRDPHLTTRAWTSAAWRMRRARLP